jgi:hypothetical protein
MEKWEYVLVLFIWDDYSKKWLVQAGNTPRYDSQGFGADLNSFGEEGWELVSTVADAWVPAESGPGGYGGGRVFTYRSYFKRRKP